MTDSPRLPAGEARRPPLPRGRGRWPILAVALLIVLLLVPPMFALAGAEPLPSSARDSPDPAAGHPADDLTAGWTTFHGGENRSGVTSANGPTMATVRWIHEIGNFQIHMAPVASLDRVFVADVLGNLQALNESTGAVVWTATVGASPTSPDLSGNNLYLADSSGTVTDLSASNGSRLWSHSVGASVLQGVTVANFTVIVGTTSGLIVALNASTGAPVWSSTVPGRIAGAIAWENGSLYVANLSGGVFRLDGAGGHLWSTTVGAQLSSAVAATQGNVYAADLAGNVTALWAGNGSVHWRFHDPSAGDGFESTPAVAPGLLVVASNAGLAFGISPSNGTLIWNRTGSASGYPDLPSPVIAPNGIYLIDASQQLLDLNRSTGVPLWGSITGSGGSFTSPAVVPGQVLFGDQSGYVHDLGSNSVSVRYRVTGVVVNTTGAPISGATISTPGALGLSNATGAFALSLLNGSYLLNVSANLYLPTLVPLTVSGPPPPLSVVLRPLPLFRFQGVVVDGLSGKPLAGTNVTVFGEYGYFSSNRSAADGSFVLWAPNGSDYITVDPPPGYSGLQAHVLIEGGLVGTNSLRLELPSTQLLPPDSDPWHSVLLVSLLGLACATLIAGIGWRARRQAEQNLSRSFLTPFERFLTMRMLLIVPQIVGILIILYVFGTVLPAAALSQSACTIGSDPVCFLTGFFTGFWTFLHNLFTGNWGQVRYSRLVEPAANFFYWWGPYTIELAVVALAIAAVIAYPLGLWAGWRPDRVVDHSARVVSISTLLLPSFLIVLLVLGLVYLPFLHTVGDTPYGILPSVQWYSQTGTPYPNWIGIAGQTSPTGFPLIDGLVHGDYPFEFVVLSKTLLQASLIAIVFVAIFLRFARHTVAEAVAEPHVSAARSRGVTERRLLWHHTGHRVLPLFVLVLGLTIPIYLGVQALVEAMFNDPGLGTLLLAEMTNVETTRFGYASLTGVQPGNIYQVAVFFTALVVLLVSLVADIVARVLDPRLAAGERA